MHRALFARPSRITERGGTPFDSGINGMSRGVRSPGAWSVQPRSVFAPRDGYRQAIADSGEAPTYAGINNKSPFINDLFEKAVLKYGTNLVSAESDMGSAVRGAEAVCGASHASAQRTIADSPALPAVT
jgi:hypothetical protein